MPQQHKSYSPKERHKHELPGMKYYIILVSFFQLHPSDKALICPISRIFFTGQINSSCSCSENLSPKSSPRRAGINPGPLFHVQTTFTSPVPHRLTFTTPAPDWPDDWVSPSGTGARHYSSNRRWLQTGVSAAAQAPRRWAASEAVGGGRWEVGGNTRRVPRSRSTPFNKLCSLQLGGRQFNYNCNSRFHPSVVEADLRWLSHIRSH